MNWHLGPLLAFDTETSGVDTETDRIVSAAAITMHDATADATTWLADPGIEIPADATKIHHITTEHARTNGEPAKQVIAEIIAVLAAAVEAGVPLVGHNIAYDLTILDRETRRHLGLDLHTALGGPPLVIDTMVLDKLVIPFRRRVSDTQGARQLRTCAEVYCLGWDEDAAHGAEYDALMAGRIAWHIGHIAHLPWDQRPPWVKRIHPQRFDRLRGHDLDTLHAAQIIWARLDAESYQAWLRNPEKAKEKHDATAVIDGSWPLRPLPTEEASAS